MARKWPESPLLALLILAAFAVASWLLWQRSESLTARCAADGLVCQSILPALSLICGLVAGVGLLGFIVAACTTDGPVSP